MRSLIIRTITGLLFVAVVLTCFLRPITMTLLFALVTGMTVWEFVGLVNQRGAAVNRFITTAAAVFLFLAITGFCGQMATAAVFIPYLLTVVYLFVSGLFTRSDDPICDWAYAMMAQMYIAVPFGCLAVLAFRAMPTGEVTYNMMLPVALFVFLWMNDTGAYLTGSVLGRHKLFPRVSPGKTWEGSAGGAVLVLVVAALVAYLDHTAALASLGATDTALSTAEWLGLGVVVVVFGTLGDLVESLFKRTLGIKDSGAILPGHGGMLDRFDSSLMAIPAAVVYLYTLTVV